MVEYRSVVEHAHESLALTKDIENYSKESPCVLLEKFVGRGIISKLPHSWRDFATSLKHKRKKFNLVGLIGTLDIEEKARSKDTYGKCDRTTSKMRGFVSQDHIGGFSTKRECVNTHK
jgi:hypothetical protein